VTGRAEPTGDLPVDSGQADRNATAADEPLSPVQRYVSYDERPLPAIRRLVSSVRMMNKLCTQPLGNKIQLQQHSIK